MRSMFEYVFFFFGHPSGVPNFDLFSCSSDKAAVRAAARLARSRTVCSKIEVWRDGKHVAHLPCRVLNRYDWPAESPASMGPSAEA